MHIKPNHDSYTRNQTTKVENRQISSISQGNQEATNSDTVSISNDYRERFLTDELKFQINNALHVYTKNPQNLATLGTLTVSESRELSPATSSKSILEQKLLGQDFVETYIEITEDPVKAMEDGLAGYQEFLHKAKAIVVEIKELDTTNSFDVTINGDASLTIKYKDSLNGYVSDQAIKDREAIRIWEGENFDIRKGFSDLSNKYSIAKSIKDYESATGISRDEIMDRREELRSEGSSPYTLDKGINEYLFKITNYARLSFGTNPVSYHAVDKMGTPGYPKNSQNTPKAVLPNMDGSYS